MAQQIEQQIAEMQKADAANHHWMSCWLGDATYNKSDIYAHLNARNFQAANARRSAATREKLLALISASANA